MVKRRKMMIGMGALAAGSVAGIGTGAFTSASIPDRQVTANVDDDVNSQIALVPGSDPDVSLSGGQIQLDLSGSGGEGVNINSTYTWGDPGDPANDYAFKIVNNDQQSYMLKMNYYFDDPSWITSVGSGVGNDQSFIKFQLFDAVGSYSSTYPDQRGSYNKDYSLGMPHGSGFGSNSGSYRFNPGEEYYMVVSTNTEGSRASTDDDLSGTANFVVADSTSQDSWDPRSPPS